MNLSRISSQTTTAGYQDKGRKCVKRENIRQISPWRERVMMVRRWKGAAIPGKEVTNLLIPSFPLPSHSSVSGGGVVSSPHPRPGRDQLRDRRLRSPSSEKHSNTNQMDRGRKHYFKLLTRKFKTQKKRNPILVEVTPSPSLLYRSLAHHSVEQGLQFLVVQNSGK